MRFILSVFRSNLEFDRSGRWAKVRADHLEKQPECQACGKRNGSRDVHHIVPYHERPELELDPGNLCTLCSDPCHLVHGHLMSWGRINRDVIEDCKRYRSKLEAARR